MMEKENQGEDQGEGAEPDEGQDPSGRVPRGPKTVHPVPKQVAPHLNPKPQTPNPKP